MRLVARQLCNNDSSLLGADDTRSLWNRLQSLIYVLGGKMHQFRTLP